MAHPAAGRKSTEHINFGKAVEGIPSGTYANRVLHEITRRRKALEDVLKFPDTSCSTVMNTLHEYLVMPIRNVLSEARRPFKLKFRWTSFIRHEEDPVPTKDSDVDQIAFIVAAVLWLMDHAHLVFPLYPNSDELNEDKMKDALNAFKLAAGLCECVQNHPKSDFLDLTVPVNQVLGLQCLAEAQMLTINRAVNKGNKAALVSQLAHDVAKKLNDASTVLQKCGKDIEKWRLFLMFKGELYFAVARCFQGIHLLEEQEQCGMSVTVFSFAQRHIQNAIHLSKEYAKLKPKAKCSLTDLSDFQWAQKLVALKVEKSQRENSMVYNQRVPEEAALLDDPKCLVTSIPFSLPPPNLEGLNDAASDNEIPDDDNKTQKKLLQNEVDDETQSGCACERWLFIVIFMPFLLVISLLGGIAWIILWPFNRFCNCGKPFSKVFSTAEMLMKLPLNSCRWAVGRRTGNDLEQGEELRPRYGGTDNVEMKEPRTD